MPGESFFAAGTIGLSKTGGRKPSTLLTAARHNKREIQAELGASGHIDPARTGQNETLAGPPTAAEVVALARERMTAAGVDQARLRRDHVQAVELLFSLPHGSGLEGGDYFRACLAWAAARFGAGNILSADVHRDEAAPHLHALLLPLVDGRRVGSKLLGDKRQLAALRAEFFREVASRYGLRQAPARPRGASKAEAVAMVLERIRSAQDAILKSVLWPTIRAGIERDPAPFLDALGLALPDEPRKPARTMAQIFTSPGKGAHRARDEEGRSKPIGIERGPKDGAVKPIGFGEQTSEEQSLSCVGFAFQHLPRSPFTSQSRPPPTTPRTGTARRR